jgi:Zn-dependent protease with chaperone function
LDFFEAQERARRRSRWLVLWYAAAVLGVVASYCALAAFGYWLAMQSAMPLAGHLAVASLVGGFILTVSAWHMWQLSDGGAVIAHVLGARYVDPDKCTPAERKLINVVEEMAIASGVSVPPVYVLEFDDAINALVAGYSPHEAVIIVTRGAAQKLSRDELQGMMGHEFSHILNGDMAFNVRMVGLLAGLSWLAGAAERLVFETARHNRELERDQRGAGALVALAAALIAFVGFPGTVAADAIKAAISRERELLADATSVQFTRNPDGVAGALDSILALRAHTAVRAVHCELFSHMFFAQAVARWWGFPTHPPILERIRRAHPRFRRDEYRARRHGTRTEVAVIDGSGTVVKNLRLDGAAAIVASVGRPAAEHVDYAVRLLARLPLRLREALHRADEAETAMFALALEAEEATREAELQALAARRGAEARAKAGELYVYVGALARNHMLTLADLAVPAIKEQRQKARDAFLVDLAAVVEADRRVTLREFVLLTLLRQRLREGAGQPIRTQFRRVEDVAADAHVVLSLVSLDTAAFEKGAAVLKLGWQAPLARETLTTAKVSEALERVRHLAPFEKPALLKACVEAAAADGVFRLPEVEMVRMVAATLDCPVPPAIAA